MKLQLSIQLHDYWHIGNGQGKGTHLDAVVDRDSDKLPYVPGKMLKGLLRDAAMRAASWKWEKINEQWIDHWFGMTASRNETSQGQMQISDARLDADLRSHLSQEENADLSSGLFDEMFSTAIDPETGTASDKSLRGMEVVIPLELQASLTLPNATTEDIAAFRSLLPLIRAVGANKTRGYGRATLHLQENE